jgi:hypothetical protein
VLQAACHLVVKNPRLLSGFVLSLVSTSNATSDQRRAFESLADKIQSFGFDLEIRAPTVTRVQWQSLDWGLKEIGKVSFAGLRRNYKEILSRLVQISEQGYFNWL